MNLDDNQAATALLTEHLQYTPLSLIDDIIDSVNNFVYQGVGSLEAGLFATPPERLGFKTTAMNTSGSSQIEQEYPEAKQELEEGLHKLETLLNSTVDKNFDKFEIYVLRNILSVPQDLAPWIKLSHYEGAQNLHADAPTTESIRLLRQRLAASRSVNRMLQREQTRNEAVLTQLRNMTKSHDGLSAELNFSFLSGSGATQSYSSQSQQPLTATTTFTTSQIPALQSILSDLRQNLVRLRNTPVTTDTAKDERREERREYIEQRTRLHLARSGQTLADDTNSVGGEGFDPGEIDALERVASVFHPT